MCQKYCGWAEICDEACAAQHPEGKEAFQPLPECFVCNHCRDACDAWWVTSEYCIAPDPDR
jgi:polyferredoxin